MTEDNRRALVAAERKKGDEALQAADALFSLRLYNDAVARAYYAAFHYASAALAEINVQAKSHSGLQSQFSLHLVKPGILPFARSKELRRLQGYREAADYDAEFRFDEVGAREELDLARAFVAAISAFLTES